MSKIYFRYGAMGASKTANCIMVAYNYMERGQNVLIFKSNLDTRSGSLILKSRAKLEIHCVDIDEKFDFREADLSNIHCVLIDEAQFLTNRQVVQLTEVADKMRIPVICYGLRTDFRGEFFEGSAALMRLADSIEEIKTVCWCGRKAIMNARILNGNVVYLGDQIQIGGNESYVSLCRRHWKENKLTGNLEKSESI